MPIGQLITSLRPPRFDLAAAAVAVFVSAGPALAQHVQGLTLPTAPAVGAVLPFEDRSGFLYTGPADAVADFVVVAEDDYGQTRIHVHVSGPTGMAGVENEEFGGPTALAGALDRTATAVTLMVYVWQPNIAEAPAVGARTAPGGGSDPLPPDVPLPDDSGKIKDENLPGRVPPHWSPEVIAGAIAGAITSIDQREWENEWDPDPGHDRRIAIEQEWLAKLRRRQRQLEATMGGALVGLGAYLVGAGTAGSAILVADDLTVIGVADDPLLIITGGAVAIGGAILAVDGLIGWMTGR